MGILDIFKTKKAPKPKEKAVKQAAAVVRPPKAKKEVKAAPEAPKMAALKTAAPKTAAEKKMVFGILKGPHITERASMMNEMGQYVFEVMPRSNKKLIKRAVESFYGVNVEKVRIINVPARPRRLGRTLGQKSGYKKAIVTLAKGEKIELMPH